MKLPIPYDIVSFVDAIAGLLDGPRAHNAFLLKAVFTPPWSIRIEDEAVVVMLLSLEDPRETFHG